MANPTTKQWQAFKAQFDGHYGYGYLECDGYLVAVSLVRRKNRLVHNVYVNGWFKGEWIEAVDDIDALPEEAKRFFMPKQIGRSIKDIRSYEKTMGKRWCKQHGIYRKMIIPYPSWNSINSFVAHVKKFNQEIEILSDEEYKQREENRLTSAA